MLLLLILICMYHSSFKLVERKRNIKERERESESESESLPG